MLWSSALRIVPIEFLLDYCNGGTLCNLHSCICLESVGLPTCLQIAHVMSTPDSQFLFHLSPGKSRKPFAHIDTGSSKNLCRSTSEEIDAVLASMMECCYQNSPLQSRFAYIMTTNHQDCMEGVTASAFLLVAT